MPQWDDFVIEGSEVLSNLQELSESSLLVRTCVSLNPGGLMTQGAYAVQFLSGFHRGTVEVCVGDWVLLSNPSTHVVGIVSELAVVYVPGNSVVRMLLTNEYRVQHGLSEDAGGVITVDVNAEKHLSPDGLVIAVELVGIIALALETHESCEGHLRFVYEY